MNRKSRLATLLVPLAAVLVASAAPARAQDATPAGAPPPDLNGAPGEAPAAPPVDSPPAEYAPPASYGPQATPAYPPGPPPAYPPPPGYGPPGYPPAPGYPPPYGSRAYGPPPPGYGPPTFNPGTPGNVHDGFFLRLHLGGGFTSASRNGGTASAVKLSGGSLSLGLALGGAVAENLIVFGNFFMSMADRPDSSERGTTTTLNGSAAVGGFGIGLTYYVMPANVYVSGALAVMSLSAADPGGTTLYSSNAGVGFHGMIGKEWWVSSEWGLGIAGEVMVASMKDHQDSSLTWTASAFSLLFSSTFN